MAVNPAKLKEVKRIGRKETLFCMARQAETGRVFCGSSDFKVYDVDVASDKPEPQEMTGHNSYVMGAVLAGDQLVTGSYDRQLIWWNIESRDQVRAVKAHERQIRGVVSSPDQNVVASVADDMIARLWDANTGKLIHELKGHEPKTPNHYLSMLYACTFSPDGKLLATGDKTGHVVVWDAESGKQAATFESPENYTWDPRARRHSIGGIRSLQFSPDGKQLAVGGMGKVGNIDHLGGKSLVQIYDWNKGERLHQFEHDKHKGLVETLRYHHEGNLLVGAGGAHGGFLLFYDLKANKIVHDSDAKMHVHEFVLNKASDTIYAVGSGNIAVWEMKG